MHKNNLIVKNKQLQHNKSNYKIMRFVKKVWQFWMNSVNYYKIN